MGIHWESVHVSRAEPHNKQLQRTVIQLCGVVTRARFHYARVPRCMRQRAAAAELQR